MRSVPGRRLEAELMHERETPSSTSKFGEEDDGIKELMWQNGPVTQSHRSIKKVTPSDMRDDLINADSQQDDMASWLNYPLNDTAFTSDFYSNLLYSSPLCNNAADTMNAVRTTIASAEDLESRQAVPRRPVPPSIRIDNFDHLSKLSRKPDEPEPSNSNLGVKESMVVDSSLTTALPPHLRVSDIREPLARRTANVAASVLVPAASLAGGGSEAPTYEISVTSSQGGSNASAERDVPFAPQEDRKRKGREPDDDDGDCHSQSDELGDAKKHLRCSSLTIKRSRAAEVHNLSERKRRDRINEKMKTLQELIPNCNKADKVSMLDEAIEYLKYLQFQLQMIPMEGFSSMVPTMMFPPPHGAQQHQQQYIIPQQQIEGMGMGIGIHPPMMMMMMPFSNNLAVAAAAAAPSIMPTVPPPPTLPAAAAATDGSVGVAHHLLTPTFPLQPPIFHSLQQQQLQVAGREGADPAAFRIPFTRPGGGSYRDPTMQSSSSNRVLNRIHPSRMNPNSSNHPPPFANTDSDESRNAALSKSKTGENLEYKPKG